MTDEKLWLLVSLQLSGEATPAELEELQVLLQQDPQAEARVAVFQHIWKTRHAAGADAGRAMSYDRHLQRLSNHLAAPVLQYEEENTTDNTVANNNKPMPAFRWLWAGASVAAAVILAFLFFRNPVNETLTPLKTAGNTISTKPGSKSKIELPDGTQVWLNADSKLEYKGDFSGKYREVSLSGEAYFDVVKDTSRPFIIHTSTIQVKVLGTAFNIRSYPTDKTTEASLIRGSVEVTLNGQPDKKVILKPNEKVVIDNIGSVINTADNPLKKDTAEKLMEVRNVHLDKKDKDVYETMWVKNKLAFDETPFDNMIAEIERWYNVEIIVKNKRLSANTYTVIFENKTLDEVMEGLQFSAHFQYQLKDAVVTIW